MRKTRDALAASSIDFLYHNGMTDAERSELRQLSGKGTLQLKKMLEQQGLAP